MGLGMGAVTFSVMWLIAMLCRTPNLQRAALKPNPNWNYLVASSDRPEHALPRSGQGFVVVI